MTAAVLIPVGGAMTRVDVDDDAAAMAKAIGCEWIDIIRTAIIGLSLAVDDEALITKQQPNLRASILADRMIHGDVLLIGVDLDGSTVDLPADEIDQLTAIGEFRG